MGIVRTRNPRGYGLVFVTFPFIGLFLAVSVPMARKRSAATATGVALVLTLAGIVGVTTAPLYSSWRPQHVNIQYVENVDAGTAHVTLNSANTLPDFMLNQLTFVRGRQAIYPWTGATVDNAAAVPPSGWSAPEATIVSSSIDAGVRSVALMLQLRECV